MYEIRKKFFEDLRSERDSYDKMIEFCCDSLIMNNDIINELSSAGFVFDTYCGVEYDDETDEYVDVYQLFIIGEEDAERLARYTEELVYYCESLGLYILGVSHCGTAWCCVSANWKTVDAFCSEEV